MIEQYVAVRHQWRVLRTPAFGTNEGKVFDVTHDVDRNLGRSPCNGVGADDLPRMRQRHSECIVVANAAVASASSGNRENWWDDTLKHDTCGKFVDCGSFHQLGKYGIGNGIDIPSTKTGCGQ